MDDQPTAGRTRLALPRRLLRRLPPPRRPRHRPRRLAARRPRRQRRPRLRRPRRRPRRRRPGRPPALAADGPPPSPPAPASSSSPAPTPTPRPSTAPPTSSPASSRTSTGARPAAATTSPSPAPTTASGTRSRSTASPTPRASPSTTATKPLRSRRKPGSARDYQMTAQVNRVNPGGAAQTAHRDYHLGFMSRRAGRPLPGPRPPPLPGPDAAGCRRPRRHAGRKRPDAPPPLQPALPRRLPRLRAPRLPGLISRPPRPAAAREGRPPLLQPGADARRRHQPHRRPLPHGEPAAGLVRLRPRHGSDRPRRG